MGKRNQFFLAGLILVIVTLGLWSNSEIMFDTPQYTNMTYEESGEQMSKLFSDRANACREAGGNWIVGFADARCTIAYQSPDTSWYIVPEINPDYSYRTKLATLFAVGAIFTSIFVIIAVIALAFTPSHEFD